MKRLAPVFLIAALLSGCWRTTRPDQENFTVRASNEQITALLDRLATSFGKSPSDTQVSSGGPGKVYWIGWGLATELGFHTSTASLTITQIPDGRCDPNVYQETFHGREYSIDLVYWSSKPVDRASAKNAVIRAAHAERLRITDFKEC